MKTFFCWVSLSICLLSIRQILAYQIWKTHHDKGNRIVLLALCSPSNNFILKTNLFLKKWREGFLTDSEKAGYFACKWEVSLAVLWKGWWQCSAPGILQQCFQFLLALLFVKYCILFVTQLEACQLVKAGGGEDELPALPVSVHYVMIFSFLLL